MHVDTEVWRPLLRIHSSDILDFPLQMVLERNTARIYNLRASQDVFEIPAKKKGHPFWLPFWLPALCSRILTAMRIPPPDPLRATAAMGGSSEERTFQFAPSTGVIILMLPGCQSHKMGGCFPYKTHHLRGDLDHDKKDNEASSRVAVGQESGIPPNGLPWEVETCGPIPGGLILTHTHLRLPAYATVWKVWTRVCFGCRRAVQNFKTKVFSAKSTWADVGLHLNVSVQSTTGNQPLGYSLATGRMDFRKNGPCNPSEST